MARVIDEVITCSFAEVNDKVAELRAAGHLARAQKLSTGMWEIHVSVDAGTPVSAPRPRRVAQWHHERDRENLAGANASGFLPCSSKEQAEQVQAGLLRKGALRATIVKGGVSFCF